MRGSWGWMKTEADHYMLPECNLVLNLTVHTQDALHYSLLPICSTFAADLNVIFHPLFSFIKFSID